MLLQILGFLLSAIAVSLGLLSRFTGDVYPRAFKKFLHKVALRNWQSSLRKRLGTYSLLAPASTQDAGILPNHDDNAVEAAATIHRPEETDGLLIYGMDEDGNALVVRIRRYFGDTAEGNVYLRVKGNAYAATCSGKSSGEFAVGTLRLELVEAMRKWRIWFNGIATDVNNADRQIHLVINSLWKPLEEPGDLQKDANVDLLADNLTSAGSFGQNLLQLQHRIPEGYSQFGTCHATIQTGDDKNEMYFYGFRVRKFLNLRDVEQRSENDFEFFAMKNQDGNGFRFSSCDGLWIQAETLHASSIVRPILALEADPKSFARNQSIPKFFSLSDSTGTQIVEVWRQESIFESDTLEVVVVNLTANAEKCRGVLIREKWSQFWMQSSHNSLTRDLLASESDFLALDSPSCLSVKLVGGKGASLAALANYVKENHIDDKYKTSQGFCVTTSFFRRILDLDRIKQIFAHASNDAELSSACSQVRQLILNSNIENTIAPLVAVWMNKTFVKCKDGKFSHLTASRFAVRSSGTLEDGADVSSAGQNETFLGTKEEQVPGRILQCWASLFTLQSVRYRLSHGQPAVSDMGVVVQAMVNATAAGVIFTANPITGNPFELLINANYGLGESVVSARCDPDTVIIKRSDDGRDSLSVLSKTVGNKISKVVMEDNSLGSTKEVPVSEAEASACCISDEVAIQLAEISLLLVASNDGKPLDIEWAVDGSTIYILQSRNITSLDLWTDFEITHECDTPLRTSFERLTNANTGEVAPGAYSPLGLSVVPKTLDYVLQRRMYERYSTMPRPSCYQIIAHVRYRLFLNILQVMYRHVDKKIEGAMVAVDLAVFGHRVINDELHKLAAARWGFQSAWKKISSFGVILSLIWRSKSMVENGLKKLSNYHLKVEDVKQDKVALYNRILDDLIVLIEACNLHGAMSDASSGMQILTISVLTEGKDAEDWDPRVYNDVSTMLSVCNNVESADIPSAIDKLVKTVLEQGDSVVSEILTADAEKAFELLQNNTTISGAYDEFMGKHGHRCIFELDLMRQPWKTNPSPFVKLLQSIISSKSKLKNFAVAPPKKQYDSDDELIKNLQLPIKNSTRRLVKFMLPYCRSTVWNREKSKSLLVWVGNEFKKAFNILGQLLAQEHVIPNTEMIYFFTLGEIGQLIQKSPTSSRILFKAMRRQKLHPVLDKDEYAEILIGIPKPTDKDEHIKVGDFISGTPVSSGKIRGVVKVCHTVEDAAELIKPGDIMVAHSTDIGWSPFFPILGGVVTELGGLISHGAVVAREYGLPCIVGATHATKVFTSGETVVLDATKGVMYKVSKAAETTASLDDH